MPILLALAKPKFSPLRISLTSGKRSATSSGVPSLEALSTTTTSEYALPQHSRKDARQSITYCLAFHTTMTMETRAVLACNAWNGRGDIVLGDKFIALSNMPVKGTAEPGESGHTS